jgi:hypothetical protein
MQRIIDDEEIEIDKNYINARMIGHRFSKMRLTKDLYQRPRQWKITRSELMTMFTAYRIPIPKEIEKILDSGLGINGKNGENGENGAVTAVSTVLAIDETGQPDDLL